MHNFQNIPKGVLSLISEGYTRYVTGAYLDDGLPDDLSDHLLDIERCGVHTDNMTLFSKKTGLSRYMAVAKSPNPCVPELVMGRAFECEPIDLLRVSRFGQDEIYAVIGDYHKFFLGQKLRQLDGLKKLSWLLGDLNGGFNHVYCACEPPRKYSFFEVSDREVIIIDV